MGNIKCARCDREVEKIKSKTIELVNYCESCAKQVKKKKKEERK
jgi:DNA-directed RNA polymerase subunit RPC12/RpoP